MPPSSRKVKVTLLGVAQDGGRPQPGCFRECCLDAYEDPSLVRHLTCIGIVGADYSTHLVESTRDMAWQFGCWSRSDPVEGPLTSLWITHAHFGHVDGLGLFGKETIATRGLPIHCSTSFSRLLEKDVHWSTMVNQGVLSPRPFLSEKPVKAYPDSGFKITPISIPHRSELSDMHGFLISGPNSKLLFLPDHDSWDETLLKVEKEGIRNWFNDMDVDVVLLDGTFWSSEELGNRDQSLVPHPPVKETIERLGERVEGDPRIIFIHLNHTNPLHDLNSNEAAIVQSLGWEIGVEGMVFEL